MELLTFANAEIILRRAAGPYILCFADDLSVDALSQNQTLPDQAATS